MNEELNPLKRLAESILYVFTLPEREAFIDENQGYVNKHESEKRILICNLGLNLMLQVVTIACVTIHFSFYHEILGPQQRLLNNLSMYILNQVIEQKKTKKNFQV